MGTINNKRLMVKVCELYFLQNRSQKEISADLGISRPQISRLITMARESGIVNITVNNPYVRETQLEKALMEKFGIRDVLVIDGSSAEGENVFQSFAKEAARLIEDYLPQDACVGVMSGYTVKAVIDHMEESPKRLKLVVPLMGGISTTNMAIHADTLALQLGRLHHAAALNLNAPAVVSDRGLADSLKKEEAVAKVLEAGRKVDVALVGIGNLDGTATNVRLGSLKEADLRKLQEEGAVSSVCGSYFDGEGREVGEDITSRTVGLTLREMKRSKIIAAAVGLQKIPAIVSALKSDRIGLFVTDIETAKKMIQEDYYEKNQ